MADEGEEQKPNVGAGPEHLNLQVKSQVWGYMPQQMCRCIYVKKLSDLCIAATLRHVLNLG